MASLRIGPDGEDDDLRLPDEVEKVLDFFNWEMFYPDGDVDPGTMEIYARAAEGQCMSCGSALGDDTMIVTNKLGILMVYCGGACYTDMQVLGWIQEQHEDIVSALKMRGGRGDQPE